MAALLRSTTSRRRTDSSGYLPTVEGERPSPTAASNDGGKTYCDRHQRHHRHRAGGLGPSSVTQMTLMTLMTLPVPSSG
jgi:hypothetical protein